MICARPSQTVGEQSLSVISSASSDGLLLDLALMLHSVLQELILLG